MIRHSSERNQPCRLSQRQKQGGFGLALILSFLLSSVLLGMSIQFMLSNTSGNFVGAPSQNYLSAEEMTKTGMVAVQNDIQNKLNAGTQVTSSYTFPSTNVYMPSNPNTLGTLDKLIGSYSASMTLQRGNTYLVKVTATVGSSVATLSKLLTMTRNLFILDTIGSAKGAYGLRRLSATYTGPAIQVTRSSDSTTKNIGFTAAGDLDTVRISNFLQGSGTVTPPLNSVTGAVAAYSIRLLKSAYTGKCMNVRRSSDNTTQDIGFTASGDLDTPSLLTFVGSGDGYVATWYDQSGNNINAIQGTQANQPMIVSGGTVETINSRPTILFNTTNQTELVTANTTLLPVGSTNRTLNAVFELITTTGTQALFSWGNDASNGAMSGMLQNYPNLGFWGFNDDITSNLTPNTTLHVASILDNSNTVSVYQDSVLAISGSPSPTLNTSNSTPIYIGGSGVWNNYLNGYISEVIIYGSALSAANQSTLETNQDDYYNMNGGSSGSPTGYVNTWFDQSGSGNNLTQPNSGSQPTIVLNGANGYATINFSGSQYLYNSAMTTLTGANITSMLVSDISSTSSTSGQIAALQKTGDTTDYGTSTSFELLGLNGSTSSVKGEAHSSSATGAVTSGTFFQSTSYHDSTNALDLYLNGSQTAAATVTASVAPNYLVVGAGRASSAIGNYFTGNVSELILYQSALSRANQQIVENNEISYYGLP